MTTFNVFRYDPAVDKCPRMETFDVKNEKGMTVLEGLFYILENLDPTICFRSSCRAAVCGSCAMHINGQYRLACRTQIEHLKSDIVTIRPIAHSEIIKDLVVDMSNFFANLEKIKPYIINEGPFPEKEFLQSESERKGIDHLIDCILCGCCYSSCPSAGTNEDYLGPHALMKTLRFINDPRDKGGRERLTFVSSENGVFRCHTVFNCQEVCPKDLDPSSAIARLKMKAVWNTLKNLVS